MKNLLLMLGGMALFLGILVQETGGDVSNLPVSVQPFVRRLQVAVAPCVNAFNAQLAPLTSKISAARPKEEKAEIVAPVPERRSPPQRMVISYRDEKNLLGQLKCVPGGQPVQLRRIDPKGGASTAGYCRTCPLSETREQREMRLAIEKELKRIAQCP